MALVAWHPAAPAALEEASANRRRGISRELDDRLRRRALAIMLEAQRALNMDMFAPLTAAVLFNRYYATRSFLANDRFLISCACLYAAGKIVDSPKSAKDVFAACYRARRAPPPSEPCAAPPPELEDRAFADAARERLFVAERAVLYAVRFDVDIEVAYAPLVGQLGARQLLAVRDALAAGAVRGDAGEPAPASAWAALFEASLEFARAAYASQLCIELEARAVAAGAIEAALHVTGLASAVPPPPPGEHEWWRGAAESLDALRRTAAELIDIERLRLEDLEEAAGGRRAGEQREGPEGDLRAEVGRWGRDDAHGDDGRRERNRLSRGAAAERERGDLRRGDGFEPERGDLRRGDGFEPERGDLRRGDGLEPERGDLRRGDGLEPERGDLRRGDGFEPERGDLRRGDGFEPERGDLRRGDGFEPERGDLRRDAPAARRRGAAGPDGRARPTLGRASREGGCRDRLGDLRGASRRDGSSPRELASRRDDPSARELASRRDGSSPRELAPHRDDPSARALAPHRSRDATGLRAAPRRERDRSPPRRQRSGQERFREPSDEYDALFNGW